MGVQPVVKSKPSVAVMAPQPPVVSGVVPEQAGMLPERQGLAPPVGSFPSGDARTVARRWAGAPPGGGEWTCLAAQQWGRAPP